MDWDAFESDVWESVNESLFSDQVTAADYGDETSGLAYTIGETWVGALYGAEENGYGQRSVYLFENGSDQLEWFHSVTFDILTA